MQIVAVLFLFVAVPFFSSQVTRKVDVLEYFPQPVGMSKVYRHVYETDLGPEARRATATWTQRITVQEHVPLKDGLLIVRDVENTDVQYTFAVGMSDSDKESIRSNFPTTSPQHLLIHGNYVYEIDEADLDPATRRPQYELEERINKGQVPAYFFPMDACHAWAEVDREAADIELERKWKAGEGEAPNPGMYYWTVEGLEIVSVPYGKVEDAHLIRYRTLGGYEARWFKPGLGLVRQETKHQGTFIESSAELVSVEK